MTIKRLRIALFLFALLIRVAYTLLKLRSNGLERGYDAGDYIQFAEFMQVQGWMVEDISALNLHAGPGYPWVLFLDMSLSGGNSFYLSIALNVVVSALFCVLLFHLLLNLGLNRNISLGAGLWASLYVQHLRYVPELNKETLVIFLLAFVIYTLYQRPEMIKFRMLALGALAYSYLIHIDERYFFYIPFLVVFMLLPPLKSGVRNAMLFSFLVILSMIPWLYRNYIVFERPVILTERTAPFTDKLLGYESPANPYRQDPISPYQRTNIPVYEAFTDSLIQGYELKSKGYRYLDLMKEGIQNADTPYTQGKWEAKWSEFKEMYKPVHFQGAYTANGYRYQRPWKAASNLIYGLQYGGLLLLLPFGIVQLSRTHRRLLYLILMVIVVHTLIHVFIAYGLQRYRVPIDFCLMILGAFGVQFIIKKATN